MPFSYLPHTQADREAMLNAIGAQTVSELFADVPPELRLSDGLRLEEGLAEADLLKKIKEMAAKNANFDEYLYFLGAGAYDHFVPALVDSLSSRSEFSTAYTQYQPEVAQGYLQALWEYQSMISELTGLAVCNASLYDGGSALAEAMMLAAAHTKRREILVSKTLHPHYRQILNTYAVDLGLQLKEISYLGGVTDLVSLEQEISGQTAALLIQSPNFFGCVEDLAAFSQVAKQKGALFIVSADPISLALLEAPGILGADIVTGEGQPLGIASSFGGPGLGFFATTEKLMRKMPGRIVGQTVDSEGKRGFVLTLQAREQHIRREKATSNICSNQALCALMAAIYLGAAGKNGLKQVAGLCLQKTHYASRELSKLAGYEQAFPAPFFKEFVLKVPRQVQNINKALLEAKIIGGLDLGKYYPELDRHMLICVTEKRTKADIDLLAEKLGGLK